MIVYMTEIKLPPKIEFDKEDINLTNIIIYSYILFYNIYLKPILQGV